MLSNKAYKTYLYWKKEEAEIFCILFQIVLKYLFISNL